MAKLAVASTGIGGGSRRGVVALLLLPLAGLLAACGPSAAGDDPNDPSNDLLVLAATPTNGQETKNDLSDPELDQRIAVRFSTTPSRSAMIDETNSFNQLTPNVQLLDQNFARVKGTPSIDPDTQSFYFEPENKNLDDGQYTLTISKFVATSAGSLLNHGLEDFSTSFTAKEDVWSPVVRNTSPVANQSNVPLFTPIVVTFNESLDPASVVYGQTVFVEDSATNPPTALTGTVILKRDGFDLVFLPDPCTGMPQGTTIVVRMLGFNAASTFANVTYIKDRVGNPLIGDPTNNDEVSFQFNTVGLAKVLPTIVPAIASPKIGAYSGYAAFVSSNKLTVEFEMVGCYYDYLVNAVVSPSWVQQVLAKNPVPTLLFDAFGNVIGWTYAGSWGGDWEVNFEKAGEAVIDPRQDPLTGLTYIYQIDEGKEAVLIIDNFGKVQGKFKGLGTPKGIGISAPGAAGLAPVLYVTNYSQATLTGIPLGLIQPGKNICTALQELNDDTSQRVYMETGKNPSGVAIEYWGTAFGAVVNQADNEVQIFDAATMQPFNRLGQGTLSKVYQVGANPLDAGWDFPIGGGGLMIGYIVNQGDVDEPGGSISVWWNNTTLFPPFNTLSGAVAATVSDGIEVPGRPVAGCSPFEPLSCWIPNTASDDVVRVDVSVQGGYIYSTLSAGIGMAKTLGPNPTSVTWTGRPLGFVGAPVEMCFATLAGLGQVAVWEKIGGGIGPVAMYPMPGCRYTFAHWNQ